MWRRPSRSTTGGPAAKVESLGTGGGFKLFCSGTGSAYPDVANASRPMKKSEWDKCQAAGVTEIVEIKIGYDGIVIADAKARPGLQPDARTDLPRARRRGPARPPASAPTPPRPGPRSTSGLPAKPILVYGPPPTSGTRDAFSELAMEEGGEKIPALAALKKTNEDDFKAKTHKIRSDGAWVDAGENDNAIVQTLEKTPNALGVFGYSFLENNMDKVKAATVDGVAPTFETISSGAYPLSRSLYIYVKKANIGVTPGLQGIPRRLHLGRGHRQGRLPAAARPDPAAARRPRRPEGGGEGPHADDAADVLDRKT